MDFSRYADSTSEWDAYTSSNPKSLVDGGIPTQPLTAFRTSSNEGRSRWSTKQTTMQGLDGRFSTNDFEVPMRDGTAIRLRRYAPTGINKASRQPAFIHLHGGGYLNGSIETEGSLAAAIAVELNIIVLHPEYRHTDTVKFPTMFDDAWDAYNWIFENTEALGIDQDRVIIGGQSAGSGLAAATVQQDLAACTDSSPRARVKGQILTIPWLMHPAAFPYDRFANYEHTSPIQCAHKSGLSQAKLDWFASLLDTSDVLDPRLNPGLRQHHELDGTPKTAVLVAGGDPLRDQGLAYATSLLEERSVIFRSHEFM